MQKQVPAPAQGQHTNSAFPTRPPQDLVVTTGTANRINLSPDVPTSIDVQIRGRGVRYTSDPRPGATAGLWRTNHDLMPERFSPLALLRISVGAGERIEVLAIRPRTGDLYPFEGSVDEIVSDFHQAGARLGIRAPRARIYWALSEFFAWARRQAARGADL